MIPRYDHNDNEISEGKFIVLEPNGKFTEEFANVKFETPYKVIRNTAFYPLVYIQVENIAYWVPISNCRVVEDPRVFLKELPI